MSKLYIIIPVLNCLELTRQAVQSILSSDVEVDYKIIIIDQDSTDGTREWAIGMKNTTPQLFDYIQHSPRVPLAAAWNEGTKLAFEDEECQYVALLNNDLVLHPKTLKHLMAFMDKTGYMMVTGDNIQDRMSIDVMKQMELPQPFTDFDCSPISDWRAEGPDFSCFLINRETIRVVGWFDENFIGAYCEDQDYHARIERARRHIKEHSDHNIDAEKVHAKRLSTAPYYHLASQTIKYNPDIRAEISKNHARNRDYYTTKWGGDHPFVMDGGGNIQPFGDAKKNWRDW